MYWKKFTLIHWNVIQSGRLPFDVLVGGEPGKSLEVVDEVRLIVKAAVHGDSAPLNGLILFYCLDRFLKTGDLEILFWRHTNLPFEQVNEVFLGIPDLFPQFFEIKQSGLAKHAGDRIFYAVGFCIIVNLIPGHIQQEQFNQLEHPL